MSEDAAEIIRRMKTGGILDKPCACGQPAVWLTGRYPRKRGVCQKCMDGLNEKRRQRRRRKGQ